MREDHISESYFTSLQNQAAVNAIRATGATSQLILVEGTSWTGAWSMYSFAQLTGNI